MGFSESDLRQLEANQRAANPLSDSEERKLMAYMDDRAQRKSEADLERTCTQVLEMDGWRSLKTNPVSRRAHGKGFGELGMADYLYIRYETPPGTRRRGCAEVCWIEWKRPGTEAHPHQLDWQAAERNRGALVVLADVDFEATIDGFCAWYEASGLKRSR
jgi:hypothetical protein